VDGEPNPEAILTEDSDSDGVDSEAVGLNEFQAPVDELLEILEIDVSDNEDIDPW
jgi:hypothetical protein